MTFIPDEVYQEAWAENLARDARDAAMMAKAWPYLEDLAKEENEWYPWDSEEDYEEYMLWECMMSERM
tara:strand:- start:502 stop:705 length:204 start_codon:yes stop_codon:yes gene_type:complete